MGKFIASVLVSVALSGAMTAAGLKYLARRAHERLDAEIRHKDDEINELRNRIAALEWDDQWRAYRHGQYTP